MWIPALAVVFGALAMGRTKPKTKCEKKTILGTRTGVTYEVEDFKEAGFIVVKAPDGSQGVFEYASLSQPGQPGFLWRQGRGQPKTMAGMFADLGARVPQKSAQKDSGPSHV